LECKEAEEEDKEDNKRKKLNQLPRNAKLLLKMFI